ncbi:MAG: hypothetical protein Q8J68_14490 [Methanolobus sp.]|uniref:hypothetical protein n=1 Tax=Methanolobus sp. TaxID=1874737 RepID=UPI00272F5E83|nr:hypothetical protein [Methanolobus sp.]MDP2218482.1 hypothetical protein [Methanolobus sp.]
MVQRYENAHTHKYNKSSGTARFSILWIVVLASVFLILAASPAAAAPYAYPTEKSIYPIDDKYLIDDDSTSIKLGSEFEQMVGVRIAGGEPSNSHILFEVDLITSSDTPIDYLFNDIEKLPLGKYEIQLNLNDPLRGEPLWYEVNEITVADLDNNGAIPEFPTIALPMLAIIWLALIFRRKE